MQRNNWFVIGLVVSIIDASSFLTLALRGTDVTALWPEALLIFIAPLLFTLAIFLEWQAFTVTLYIASLLGSLAFMAIPAIAPNQGPEAVLFVCLAIYLAFLLLGLVFGTFMQLSYLARRLRR